MKEKGGERRGGGDGMKGGAADGVGGEEGKKKMWRGKLEVEEQGNAEVKCFGTQYEMDTLADSLDPTPSVM